MNKGTILDLIPIMVLIFVSAIGIIIAGKVINDVNEVYTPTSATGLKIMPSGTAAINVFNVGFLIFTVGLGIAAIIGAFMIRTHPVFFFLSVIILGLMLLVAPRFTNAWNVFIANPEVSTIGNNFPIMAEIMANLPLILLGFGALILIAMYGKMRGDTY